MSDKFLNVLHIAPTPFFADRGCHIRIKGMIGALNNIGVQSIVCSYHHGRNIPGFEIYRINKIKGYTRLEAGPSKYKFWADFKLLWLVCKTIKAKKPDIIHGHLHEGALIGWLARRLLFLRKTPLVFDVQGSLVGELSTFNFFRGSKLFYKAFWLIEYLITRMPDFFICSSLSSAELLTNSFRVAPEKIKVVHDGIENEMFDQREGNNLRSLLNINRESKVIIYTGSLLQGKGVQLLHSCIVALLRKRRDIHFLILGYPEKETLDFIRRNQVEKACAVVGKIPYESLPQYLSIADLALDPKVGNSGEASGKIINYMGAGLPVVCFNNENNKRLLNDLGYFAISDTAEDFLIAIETALADLDRAKERGISGRKRAIEEFSWDTGASSIQTIYESVLNQ